MPPPSPPSGESPALQNDGKIRVMLVDDSAVIRGALTNILKTDPDIAIVSSASDGEMAIKAAGEKKPHIVILDVEMPIMDGLTALPKILEASPNARVIMFSSLTEKGASVTLKALSLGAVECMVKPSSAQGVGEGSEFQKNLLTLIKGLITKEERTQKTQTAWASTQNTEFTLHNNPNAYKGKPSLVAIGSSTGGPQALFEVTKHFKGFDVPVVVTQHMPATFTKILADHIQQQTSAPTHEGTENMPLEKGRIYIAPGGKHMHIVQKDGRPMIHVDDGPPENYCKPSVEPMFRTAIDIYGNKTLGVMLTGMGNDGLLASRKLVERGGRLIAQDEATSVVWGMPGAVAVDGICSEVLPLRDIGPWIKKAVLG